MAIYYSVTLLTLYILETNFHNPSQWSNMDNAKTEELVIKVEESLDFSSLESGPKLIGAIIANKVLNKGAINNILMKDWESFGEAKSLVFY